MNWLTEEQIIKFMAHYNYDIRKSHNARWIDQKCTPEVLCIIAACIFAMIKFFERFKKKEVPKEKEKAKNEEVLLLEEIRDLLKQK